MNAEPETCRHPATRQFWWFARDDTAPGGKVLCGACCDCGAILAGGVDLETGQDLPALVSGVDKAAQVEEPRPTEGLECEARHS